jgi:hypothetical protein
MKQPRPEHLVEEQRGMAEVVYVGSALAVGAKATVDLVKEFPVSQRV